MPTYAYVCSACGHQFDEFQGFSDPPLAKCPKCKKSKLKREFGTGAALLFKGSGFYQTDYRSESYHQAAKADQQAQTKSNGDGGTSASTEPSGKKPKTKASAPAQSTT